MTLFSPYYSLKKAKKILKHTIQLYKRKKRALSSYEQGEIEILLLSLHTFIASKSRKEAHPLCLKAEHLTNTTLRKPFLIRMRDTIISLGCALLVAILIRQMVFELYEIPTGSMRPTFKEQDRLLVSKTSFGINFPLTPKHLYFNPELVTRGQTIVFTGENMDIPDVDTKYFYIFPGKKLYVKRLLGKPGDTLYFHGGLIYGIDASGKDISHELQPVILDKIDHIPFIHFEGNISPCGRTAQSILSPIVLYQMHEPIAKLTYSLPQKAQGEMLVPGITEYSDLWGIGNFAMARLLTKEELKDYTSEPLEPGMLYLELRHHPSIKTAFLGYDMQGRLRPMLGTESSFFPLQEKHARAIFDSLYTARFTVKDEIAYRYSIETKNISNKFSPKLDGVPDGCYEFYYGTAYSIGFGGIAQRLPSNHPLYHFDARRLQILFNLGIEWDTHFMPNPMHPDLFPSRYSFFRNGSLYTMGSPIADANDPAILTFIKKEEAKTTTTYQPFIPTTPPSIDQIKKYGLKIPPKMYLALGDNHAMSGDSRCFGFVPEGNLRGNPVFIFWPPGSRFGAPNQPFPYSISPPTVWMGTLLCLLIGSWYFIQRKKSKHLDL